MQEVASRSVLSRQLISYISVAEERSLCSALAGACLPDSDGCGTLLWGSRRGRAALALSHYAYPKGKVEHEEQGEMAGMGERQKMGTLQLQCRQ